MNYGMPYSPNYGAPGFAAAPGYAPQYGGLAALAPPGFMTAAGDVPATPPAAGTGTMDTVKVWLNTPTVGVPRKYLLGGAATLGLIYYGYNQGWFGGRRPTRARRDVGARRF